MDIKILKNIISASEVIMSNLEKVSKYQLSHGHRHYHILKESLKLFSCSKTQKITNCKN
jgi:hypothetical protein